MNVRTEEKGDTAIIYLSGDFDISNSSLVRDELKKLLDTGKRIIIDLSGIRYVDSTGVATLVWGFRASQDKKIEFALRGVRGPVEDVLKITRLDSIFPRAEEPIS